MNQTKLSPSRKDLHFSRRGFYLLAVAGIAFFPMSVHGVEPMLDIGVFKLSRLEAFNLARDGKFPEAVQAEERALRIAQAQFGQLHPSLVPLYSDLGTLHRAMGEFKKSEQEYKWGLALLEKNMGPDHPFAAEFLDNLASLELDLGRNPEAEGLEKRALSIRRSEPSGNPLFLAQTLGLLGRIESNLKNYSEAQNLFQEALDKLEKNPNPDAALSINLLTAQARAYQSEKNFPQAQSCLEKAEDIAKKHFQADGVEVADAMVRLADFFQTQNQKEKALPLYESALQVDRRFVGSVYSYPALPYLRRLAKVEWSAGDAKASEDLWDKSIRIEKEVFGPQHPRIALDLLHLAEVESALKKKNRVQEHLKESINILKNYFPDDDPLIVLARKRLSQH